MAGRLRAVTRLPVSWRNVPTPSPSWRTICASSPCACLRSRSSRPISLSILPSFSSTGRTRPLISSVRLAISPALRSSSACRCCSSRSASESPVCESTSAEIALSSSLTRWRSRRISAATQAPPSSTPMTSSRMFISAERSQERRMARRHAGRARAKGAPTAGATPPACTRALGARAARRHRTPGQARGIGHNKPVLTPENGAVMLGTSPGAVRADWRCGARDQFQIRGATPGRVSLRVGSARTRRM